MRLRVDWRSSLSLTGTVLKWLPVALALPLAVAIYDAQDVIPFLASVVISGVVGLGLERATPDPTLDHRDAFLTVALIWLGIGLLGSIPFVMADAGTLAHPVNAAFESMSGITTTGATVIRDFDVHSRAIMLWRAILQWVGGLGILLLTIGLLAKLRIGGAHLMETETQSQSVHKLTPHLRQTARLIWGVYLGLTALTAIVLYALHVVGLAPAMDAFNAVAHAFTSISTAGFSPKAESVAAFSPAVQWALVPAMVIGATNFVLLYAVTQGRWRRPLENEEFRFYLVVLGGLSTLVAVFLVLDPRFVGTSEATLRHAIFNVVSIVTTTGYASIDFDLWTPGAKHVLFLAMFLGGMAGSTTCSIKLVRWLVILKEFRRMLYAAVHPDVITPLRLSDEVVQEQTVRDIFSYVMLALVVFFALTLFVVIDAARVGVAVTEFEALGAAASIFFNIGPAFGLAGPFASYANFPISTRAVMVVMMWIGRIEIVPVLILLTRSYWVD